MSIFDDKRLNIIIGAYGSGKSEISVNAARIMKESKPENKVLIADMDIVNPFYRSADAAKKLEDLDIRVVLPSYAGSNVDAPVLSGEMYVIFDDESYSGVFDIGGEDMGANVLGSLKSRLEGVDAGLYMAVNTLRPFTSDAIGIAQMVHELQEAARMKITGFINNTNLLEETTPEQILEGEGIILEASKLTGIPLLATTVMENVDISSINLECKEIITLKRTIEYNY
ncbi:MAG: hypothetical protein MJ108_10320 [Saccharofermentans sp.]|nr:hypothetical protein [Saccharofermentans sp.]